MVCGEVINFVFFISFSTFVFVLTEIRCHFVSEALPEALDADLNAPFFAVTVQ